MQYPSSFNKCYFNLPTPTPAARRRRSLDLKTILRQEFTDTGFVGPCFGTKWIWTILQVWRAKIWGFHPKQTLFWVKIRCHVQTCCFRRLTSLKLLLFAGLQTSEGRRKTRRRKKVRRKQWKNKIHQRPVARGPVVFPQCWKGPAGFPP